MKSRFRGKSGLILCLSLAIIGLIGGRYLGLQWWQQGEMTNFDQFVQRQPSTSPDERIVIVGITEEDVRSFPNGIPSDLTLAQLLKQIKKQQPRAIGLDIVRDLPVSPGTEELEQIFRTTPNLYGIGKFTELSGDAYFQKINPPPVLQKQRQVGDISVMVDFDGVIRRGNLYPTTGKTGIPSLGLLVAHQYLVREGILDKTMRDGSLILGKTNYPFFERDDGAYIRADAGGYQILMNWFTQPQNFQQVSVRDVLSEQIPPHLFTDKIILIGYYTTSLKNDSFSTPFSLHVKENQTPRQAFGVEIHANLTQYLLATALGEKPLLKTISNPLEAIWMSSWLLLSGLLVWRFREIKSSIFLIVIEIGIALLLWEISQEIHETLFRLGWWLPSFSTNLAIGLGSLVTLFYLFREKIQDYIENLEEKVKERTQSLETALITIQSNQKYLIKQEKLAFLGRLTAGFCHQFKNPLYQLKYGFSTVIESFSQKKELTQAEQEIMIDLLRELQEPINKLELIFKLILISPSQKKISYLEIKPNDFVRSITQSVVKYHSNLWLSSQIEKHLSQELETCFKIPQQLEIPFFNILENACDAVAQREKQETGFVPKILITTQRLAQQWTIIIEDNGGGISPRIKNQLFDPFITTKSETQGIGLGLYISQELMKQIGGSITVDSIADQGTKFVLVIPVGITDRALIL